MGAQSLSSRGGFVDALCAQRCWTVEKLLALLPSMRQRVCSDESVALDFWDWLFRSLCTTAAPGNSSPGNYKRLRLYEKPAVSTTVAASAFEVAAPIFGCPTPALLPQFVEFLRSHHHRHVSLSRDI